MRGHTRSQRAGALASLAERVGMLARVLGVMGVLLCSPGSQPAAADEGPRPPCGVAPEPAYADPGSEPRLRVWGEGDLSRNWRPPRCTGWQSPGFGVLVALAGSFRIQGSVDDLLARVGAMSSLREIRYWSVTEKRWVALVNEAHALRGPDPAERRHDFTASELASGDDLFFVQRDNRSTGETVYRTRVLEVSRDRFVLASENLTPVRMLVLTLFAPGELQSLYFVERRSPGVWNFYSLSRTHAGVSALAWGHEASYLNRALAYYRHLAGIPTDRPPPAAP